MTASDVEQSMDKAQKSELLPWYLRDLYKYLGAFGVLTIVYVGLRLYQGAYGISAGLDSTDPNFELYWMRLLYIELTVVAVVMIGCGHVYG